MTGHTRDRTARAGVFVTAVPCLAIVGPPRHAVACGAFMLDMDRQASAAVLVYHRVHEECFPVMGAISHEIVAPAFHRSGRSVRTGKGTCQTCRVDGIYMFATLMMKAR